MNSDLSLLRRWVTLSTGSLCFIPNKLSLFGGNKLSLNVFVVFDGKDWFLYIFVMFNAFEFMFDIILLSNV
jgi:hypothetical protein